MTNTTKKRPVEVLEDFDLQVAIWANQTEKGTLYSTDGVVRRYEDNTGDWKNTRSLSNSEVIRGGNLLTQAHNRILKLKSEAKALAKSTSEDTAE